MLTAISKGTFEILYKIYLICIKDTFHNTEIFIAIQFKRLYIHMITLVPVKQPWKICISQSYISTKKQSCMHRKKGQQNHVHIPWDIL